ncbi:Protein TOXD [Penicillium herquei]|nr:Protein TOXD [Penicillium herquei]
MTTQKAIVVTEPGKVSLVTDRPIPALRDDMILVKTVAVSVNPADWKSIEAFAPPGALTGCDFSGTVEAVGHGVKKAWKKGDRVCGTSHGSNIVQQEDGTFAEYIVTRGDIAIRVPDNLSFQEAATAGVGIITIGQVAANLKLASPAEPITDATPILIYGGSTATGTLAIQYAKLSGYTVITTCSPHNFDLVRSLGANSVFDYNEPGSAAGIRRLTNDNLKFVVDCISLQVSANFCDEAISTSGGEYLALLPVKIERENVNDRGILGYTSLGAAFKFGDIDFPAVPEHRAHAEKFVLLAEDLIRGGKMKLHPHMVGKDGLQGVLEGLKLLKDGKVSGKKLVYNVEETP